MNLNLSKIQYINDNLLHKKIIDLLIEEIQYKDNLIKEINNDNMKEKYSQLSLENNIINEKYNKLLKKYEEQTRNYNLLEKKYKELSNDHDKLKEKINKNKEKKEILKDELLKEKEHSDKLKDKLEENIEKYEELQIEINNDEKQTEINISKEKLKKAYHLIKISRELLHYFIKTKPNILLKFFKSNNFVKKTHNIYLEKYRPFFWIKKQNNFFFNFNKKNIIEHNLKLKKNMLNCSLKQEKNSCIIIYTENLGDTTIALAHFLFNSNRKDIQIYCINPYLSNCEYIKILARINNLTNITFLCNGLNSRTKLLHSQVPASISLQPTKWTEKTATEINNNLLDISNYNNTFYSLDYLSNKEIKKKIGLIFIDSVSYQEEIINGCYMVLKQHEPYIYLSKNDTEIENYKIIDKINSCSIYKSLN